MFYNGNSLVFEHPSPQQINYTPLYNFNLSFDSIGDISKKNTL